MVTCWIIFWLGCFALESSGQQNEPQQFILTTEDGSGEVRIEEYHETPPVLPPIVWLGFFLSGILLLYALDLYRQIYPSPPLYREENQNVLRERQRLLQELAHFDARYAHGKISTEQYIAERQQRKQQLIELTILYNLLSYKTIT